MKAATEAALKAIETSIVTMCGDDASLKMENVIRAFAVMRGDKRADQAEADVDTPMTRAEVAAALRVSKVTVTAWAKRGIIRRMAIPGRRKAVGYSRKSVAAILNGEVAA